MGELTGDRKKRLQAQLVERDGNVCGYCGADGEQIELSIDHKTPPARGGTHDLENLQLLCHPCNASKGQQTDEEANFPVRFASGVARAGFTVGHNVVLFDRHLSPQARLLYLQLRHYGYLSEHFAREIPDQGEMAANLGIKERALRPYVAELVEARLIRVQRRGRGLTNRYVILEPASDRQNNAGLDRQSTTRQIGSLRPLHKSKEKTEDALSKESAHASIYKSLIEACFPAGATLTKRAKQQTALAATNIVSGGGIAEMVPSVKRAYLGHPSYSKCALTPMALSNRWSELAPVVMLAPCEGCGVAGGRHAAGCERIAA